MKKLYLFTALIIAALLAATLAPAGSVIAQGDKGVLTPSPLSPHGTLLTKNPTYKWTEVTGATIYQYQVWKGTTCVLDKSPDSEDVCSGGICQKKPAYTLSYGIYKWRVRAYKGGYWSAWSGYWDFNISPPSWSNSFNSEKAGWLKRAGKDYYKSSTYIYTLGLPDKWSSIYHTNRYTDFTYSVRMKRTIGYAPNYITIRMGETVNGSGFWYPGYYFGYDNWGNAFIREVSATGSATSKYYAMSSAVVKKGWNTLQVKAIGWKFWFYINGTLIHFFTDTTFPRGFVGIASYKLGTTSQIFYVDWAKLEVNETIQ